MKTHSRSATAVLSALALGGTALLCAPPATAAQTPTPHIAELRWTSEPGGDLGYGSSRSSCDVNGDDQADAVVGDWWWDRAGASNAGAAYVLLGGENPTGGDIGAGAPVGAVRIDGPATSNAFAGMSVTCLADINGDGFDDLAVGSNRTQKVWVVLGSTNFTSVDLDTLGTRGFLVTSSTAVAGNVAPLTANFGYWVTGLGDVNGDGKADFAITDNLYDTNTTSNIGRVWVIAGSDSVADVDVDSAAGSARVLATLTGSGGQVVSAEDVGDVNGDGLADLAVGSYAATPWGSAAPVAGAAYVMFGSTTQQHVDAGNLGARGFAVYGPQRGRDRLGTSIDGVGDINGDGKADLVIGGDGVTNAATGPRAGAAAVVFGSASTQTVFTDPTSTSTAVYECDEATTNTSGVCAAAPVNRGYWLEGAADGDKFGWAAAGVPDLNGDDVPEMVIGAWSHDSGGANAGALYLVHGKKTGAGAYSMANLTQADGFRLDGDAGDQLGRSVGAIADFDGNGTPDLLGGANGNDYASVFLLGAARTTVDLAAGSMSVLGGGVLNATVSTLRTAAGPVDAGTVTFSHAGQPIPGCAAVPLDTEGHAQCPVPGLGAGGSQDFTASFTDAGGEFGDATTTLAVEVSKLIPAVGLTGDVGGTVGEALEFTATVPADATGTVTFLAGATELGSATVVDGAADLTYTPQQVGSFRLTARYDGDDRYQSRTTSSMRVSVEQVRSTIEEPELSAATVTYGARPTVSVRVNGATEGTVVFTASGLEVAEAVVGAGGTAQATLPRLDAGTHRIRATYLGTDEIAGVGPRGAAELVVTKASVTSAKVVTHKARKNTRPQVSVRFGPLDNGDVATGRVRVAFGATVRTVTLTRAHGGVIKVRAPRKLTQSVIVEATFVGNANVHTTSARARQKLR